MFECFTKKWSSHKCSNEWCSYTITFDGNWKISRLKCAYDLIEYPSEFGDLQIGCPFTPARKSYYCNNTEHNKHSLVFKYGFNKKGKAQYIALLPKHIKRTRLGILVYINKYNLVKITAQLYS